MNADMHREDAAGASLRERTLNGLGWSGLSQVLRQGSQVIITILLARLLPPADFGAVAMVMVFAGFAASFSDLGLGAALVHKQDAAPRHASSVFILQVAVGGGLSLLLAAAAPLIAAFYRSSRLLPLCLGLAPIFFLHAWSGVPLALLQKEMAFRKIGAIETAAVLASGLAAALLALAGWGAWSLVAQSVLAALLTAVLSWRACRRRPSFAFDLQSWRELRRFGAPLTAYNILNYWIRNLDNLIVGKFIGAAALGFYSRAYNLMLFPISQVGGAVSRVMFPAMASIQEQTARLRDIYLRSARLIALATFPIMAGMSVLADLFVVTVFGPAWRETAGVLRILAAIGLLQSVGTTLGWIYTSRGRTGTMFRFGLAAGIVYAAAFLVGLRWGVRGVAAAYALSGFFVLWFPSWTIAGRVIGLRFSRMVANLAGIFACTAVMGAVVFLLRRLVFAGTGWGPLLALAAAGGGTYLLLIHMARLPAYLDLRQLLRERFAAGRHSS